MSAWSASCTCTFLSIDKYQQGNNWLVLSPCNQDVVRDSLYSHSISAGQCARLFLSSRQLLRVSFFAFLSADLRVSHVLVCILFLLSSSRIPTSASASTRAQLTRQFFATTRQCQAFVAWCVVVTVEKYCRVVDVAKKIEWRVISTWS